MEREWDLRSASSGLERANMAENFDNRISCEPARRSSDAIDVSAWLALLDQLDFGIALVDGQRRLLHANRTAKAQLGDGRGLRLGGAVVEGRCALDTRELQRAIDATHLGKRHYLALGEGEHLSDFMVVPMLVVTANEPACAAIIFGRAPGCSSLAHYFFGRTHGFTGAEERLLGELSDGSSVLVAARRVGCAVNTARAHVRGMLGKTGHHTLRALISRLGNLPPIASRVVSVAQESGRLPGRLDT